MLLKMCFSNFPLLTLIMISRVVISGSETFDHELIDSQVIGEKTPVWLAACGKDGLTLADEHIIVEAIKHYQQTNNKGIRHKKIKYSLPDAKIKTLKDEILQLGNTIVSQDHSDARLVVLNQMKKSIRSKRSKSTNDTVYPEILVVGRFNSKFKSAHQPTFLAYLIYLIKFWNSVNHRFSTLVNPKVQLRITGIVINTLQEEFPFIADNLDPKTLRIRPKVVPALAAWIKKEGFIQDEEYDVAIAMTSLPFCSWDATKKKCISWRTTSGLGYSKTNCASKERAAAMFKDHDNYKGIHIATQQVARFIGAPNDYTEGLEKCFNYKRYIMSWRRDYGIAGFEWSQCSRTGIQNYLRSNLAKCFYNKNPYKDQGNLIEELLPGDKVSIEAQCDAHGYGIACEAENVCRNLECRHKMWFCVYAEAPALDGSSCNNTGICKNGICVV